jgi:hypothetical protein
MTELNKMKDIEVLFIHQLMHKWIVFKTILKIYIKIYIKTAPTCFGAVTPLSGSALLVLVKVTVVKIANYGTSVCGDVAAATSPHINLRGVQLKSGPYFNRSNLFTKIYNMLYYTTNLYLQ